MKKRLLTNLLIFGTLITVIGVIGYKHYSEIKKDVDKNW